MGNHANASPDEIRQAYAEILPYGRDRRTVCEQLLRSVAYCEGAGSPGWSVSLLKQGFRLNVGQVEALTCLYTGWDKETYGLETDVGLLHFRFLISGPEVPKLLAELDPDTVVQMNYRSVPEPHWCAEITLVVEGPDVDEDRALKLREFEAVQSSHRHFVATAARSKSGAPRQRSNFARFHCEGLMAYARDEVSLSMSDPK